MKILEAAKANLDVEVIEIGEKLYKEGHSSGIAPSSWESLRRTKVFLKVMWIKCPCCERCVEFGV